MKNIVLLLACICMLTSCGQPSYRSDEYFQQNSNNLITISNLSKEQEGLIFSNTHDYNKLLRNIYKAAHIVGTQNQQCFRAFQTPSYIDCLSLLRSVNKESAKIELITAEYLTRIGKKELAKVIYRDIITTYVGHTYDLYVMQAKIGLRDLNGK